MMLGGLRFHSGSRINVELMKLPTTCIIIAYTISVILFGFMYSFAQITPDSAVSNSFKHFIQLNIVIESSLNEYCHPHIKTPFFVQLQLHSPSGYKYHRRLIGQEIWCRSTFVDPIFVLGSIFGQIWTENQFQGAKIHNRGRGTHRKDRWRIFGFVFRALKWTSIPKFSFSPNFFSFNVIFTGLIS